MFLIDRHDVKSLEDQKAAIYAAAIHTSKPNFLPALQELQRLQICSRCCLRFAGVRSDVYKHPAPAAHLLLRAFAALVNAENGNHDQETLAAGSASASEHGQIAVEHSVSDDQAAEAGVASARVPDTASSGAQQTTAAPRLGSSPVRDQPGQQEAEETRDRLAGAEPVCRVCLGVLQSLDGPSHPVPPDLMIQLPETDSCGAHWAPLPRGNLETVADHIRSLGFENERFAVELSVPASAQLRQYALWHHLRSFPGTAELFLGHIFRDDAVDLKETLRLRWVVTEPLESLLGKPHDPEKGDLKVTISYIHPSTAVESDFLYGKPQGGRSKSRKRQRTPITVGGTRRPGRSSSENIASLAAKMSTEEFGEHRAIPPPEMHEPVHVMVSSRRIPQYVGGCYRKLERDVSQSPWMIDGARKGRTSVQEEIEKILLPALRCDGAKFVTAGREDIDVRMLGNGRPFIMEINNQRAAMPPPDVFTSMEERLRLAAVGVEVCKLQAVSKDKLQMIKDGEQNKQKSYLALCELPCKVVPEIVEKINGCTDLVLAQTTPARVAHRRAMLVRHRTVYTMQCTPVEEDSSRLQLRLRTQAGTYIKEFVHGDEGRTMPNLGSFLGCDEPAQILSLDVLEVHMDFLP